ncbi:dipeptidase [Paractinoplanes deccanensis]|uniref:Dipeptidase n=1 Tax=Paractinoplanes deccanensis TaxID=113561 RepID=A0ABQ3YJ41_9ACTN|nr:dipeptidase [Actinoplanes deccanensis]GID79982.1 dipeptidase [Actinoplanes deccanensis]
MTLSEQDLRAAIDRELPGVRADLERLVRIPGIAFDGFDHGEIRRSAEAVADLLRGCGLEPVISHDAVIARRPGPPGSPTVMLYAHHDVQPAGDRALWSSDPFEPAERDGRLYGRGTADDKSGIMAHLAALRAFGDDLPVGVVVFVEGEEEYGSRSMPAILREHAGDLRADVIVIADSTNWDLGAPALTTSLRGEINCFVKVRTLRAAVHSGIYGGPAPDALTVLARLLATLHDADGTPAVAGLGGSGDAALDYPEDRYRRLAGVLDGVHLIGTGSVAGRLWAKPAISVLGITAPPAEGAPNAIVPTAKAKVSVRVPPGTDARTAWEAVRAHLERNVPWGAQASVTLEVIGQPERMPTTGPVVDAARAALRAAWEGTEPVDMGLGGSIPLVAQLRELYPDATILVTGAEDPYSSTHSPDESIDVSEFARICLAEALLLRNLAA